MKKLSTFLIAVSLSGGPLWAQTLYAPARSLSDQGISLKGWGSGTISETDEIALEGTNSIRVSTRNYFQGGRIIFSKPIDLTSVIENKNNLLLVSIHVAGDPVAGGGPAATPMPTPAPAPRTAPRPTPQTDPFDSEFGTGGRTGATSTTVTPRTLGNVRIIVTSSDGLKSEAYLPLASANAQGWREIAIPVQAISGISRTNKLVSEIALSGDATSTFFVGDMKIVNDSTPITGEFNNETQNLALGDEVLFQAYGYAGASILTYSWDFDAKDGIQEDAEGQVIRRRFRKAGDFTVTLTIKDKYGLKQPFVSTASIKVNP